MKIHGNEQIQKGLYPETKNGVQSATENGFETILKETIENTSKVPSKTQQTTFIAPPAGVQQSVLSSLDKKLAIERLENLINLLDRYRQKLGNSNETLKNIDPIIKEISAEKDALTTIHDALPGTDGLKAIANQILVTASLEVTRFYRGDYIEG